MMKTNLAEAKMYVEKWQKLLGLQNWEIGIEIGNEEELKKLNTDIQIIPDYWDNTAIIQIREEYEPDISLEADVVHELFHLPLITLERVLGSLYEITDLDEKGKIIIRKWFENAEEQAIAPLAKMIYRLERSGKNG